MQAAVVAETASKSIAELQNEDEDSEKEYEGQRGPRNFIRYCLYQYGGRK